MYVNLWFKTEVIAVIRATKGDVQIEELKPVPPGIRANIEEQRKRVPGDEAFLRSLLVEYNGSYMYAELVKD